MLSIIKIEVTGSGFLVIQASFSSPEMEICELSRYGLKVYLKTKKFFHLGFTRDPDGNFS